MYTGVMPTITNPIAKAITALTRRGWTVTCERHGWDASCMRCGWAENFLSVETMAADCAAHDEACRAGN